jgi:hypothetical protein
MNQWKLVPCEPTPEMAAVFIPESCKTGSWIDGYKAMLNAAPAHDVQPVAWSVFDKRTQKHWYTNESVNTAGYYAKEYSHREPDGSPSMLVVPLYEHPPAAAVRDLVAALMIIAGKQRCVDSLMSNVDIALEALKIWEGK